MTRHDEIRRSYKELGEFGNVYDGIITRSTLRKKGAIGDGDKSLDFADAFIDSMKTLNPKTISREFYSGYITPLDDDIHVDGTTVHVVYALLRWEHAEEALFSFAELEREANSRGFRTVKKAIDLGAEGYFRFQKE